MIKIVYSILILGYLVTGVSLNAQDVNKESVTKLYVASFDRAPEKSGLEYWVDDSGLTLEEIATSFFDQKETQDIYINGYGNENFIDSIYSNLFKRTPDSVGKAYWLEELENGNVSKAIFILAIINGAMGEDAVILENKTAVGLEFSKSASNSIKQAYSVMVDVDASSQSVINSFSMVDSVDIDGICNSRVKNSCDSGKVVGSYEIDDSYIWFCQNSDGEISNQCEFKKDAMNISECDSSVKNGCKSGELIGEGQTSEYYVWYCKTDNTISDECKIDRGENKDTPECNNAVKNSCEVGESINEIDDDEFYYWYCSMEDKTSNKCMIEKEPLLPKCSDDEDKCIIGIVGNKSGNYDFEDEFLWECSTDLESIDCLKEKKEKIIEIDALSESKRGVWDSLNCYDYSGFDRDQGYLIQFDYREYASRCASSVEVESYNIEKFDEDKMISALKKEKESKRTLNFCENAYKADANGTEYKYKFSDILKDKCLKSIYQ